MDFTAFKNRFTGMPIILTKTVSGNNAKGRFTQPPQKLLNQLTRWQKRGLIVKLKRGMYLLNEYDRRINPSRVYLANQLCVPSYVSLAYALARYGIIPERVADVTSVTTKKTLRISNATGTYSYQHLTTSAFKGFRVERDENGSQVFIAEPEKALLDFLYFHLAGIPARSGISSELFSESFRFEDVGMLSEKRLLDLVGAYNSSRLDALTRQFCRFRREQGGK